MIRIAFMGTPEFAVPLLRRCMMPDMSCAFLHSRISPPDAADGLRHRRLRFLHRRRDTRVSTPACATAGGAWRYLSNLIRIILLPRPLVRFFRLRCLTFQGKGA